MNSNQKLCECGCGSPVKLGRRFIVYHHLRGKHNPRYKGGLYFHERTQRWFIICRDGSRQHYARAVIEGHLGRHLRSEEQVHHIDGDSTNDVPENLIILDPVTHQKVHHQYSRQELIDHIQRFYQDHGRPPRNVDFANDDSYPYPKPYLREFGRWNVALKAAGIPIHREARWVKNKTGNPISAKEAAKA